MYPRVEILGLPWASICEAWKSFQRVHRGSIYIESKSYFGP